MRDAGPRDRVPPLMFVVTGASPRSRRAVMPRRTRQRWPRGTEYRSAHECFPDSGYFTIPDTLIGWRLWGGRCATSVVSTRGMGSVMHADGAIQILLVESDSAGATR